MPSIFLPYSTEQEWDRMQKLYEGLSVFIVLCTTIFYVRYGAPRAMASTLEIITLMNLMTCCF